MDSLDAITLLYLSKNWDGQGTLLECAHTFQQTRAELEQQLRDDHGLNQALERGNYTM